MTSTGALALPLVLAGSLGAGVAANARPQQPSSPAAAAPRLHVAVLVEAQLADEAVRMGIRELAMQLQPAAAVALVAFGHRSSTLVDYTVDPSAVAAAAERLGPVVEPESNLAEALLDVAQAVERRRFEHPAIVIIAGVDRVDTGPNASNVIARIKRSGATTYAVGVLDGRGRAAPIPTVAGSDRQLMTPVRRQDVLSGAAKQAGGRYVEVKGTAGVAGAMQWIASDLLRQLPQK